MKSGSELVYRHSGKFPPIAVPVLVTGGAMAGVALGTLYAVVTYYSPLVYLNLVALGIVGLVAGGLTAALARRQHIRNPAVAALGGLVVASATLYSAWVVWLLCVGGWALDAVILRPDDIVRVADWLAIDGVWGIGSSGEPITGWMLKGVWIIEALFLLSAGLVVPLRKIRQTPYSETDRAWADHAELLPPLEPIPKPARADFQARLLGGDFAVLGELPPAGEDAASWTRYTLLATTPDGGGEEHFLTISTVEEHFKSADETVTQITPIVENLIIDPESRRLIAEIVYGDAPPEDPESPEELEAIQTTEAAAPPEPPDASAGIEEEPPSPM